MKKKFLIFFGIVMLLIIAGNGYPQSTSNKEPLSQEDIKNIIDARIDTGLKEIENKYLKDKLSFKEDIKELKNEYQEELRSFRNFIFGIPAFMGLVLAIFSFFGFKKYFSIHTQLTETKNLFDIMAKSIYEKERELHKKFDEFIGKKKDEYTDLDHANFMDYEHRLYFARAYLPLSKDVMRFKTSLFILGNYWLERERFGRALLRFQEIERLQNELDSKKNYIFKILLSLGKKEIFYERILGNKTAQYFNLHGICNYQYGLKEKEQTIKSKYFEQAISYYKKAKDTDKNYASPYYNLGILHGKNSEKQDEAINWYNQVFGKHPNIEKETYRNITCCLIRKESLLEEIINTLDNIPNSDSYWQEVINDEVINPKIKATPKLRSFILTKFPSAKNI